MENQKLKTFEKLCLLVFKLNLIFASLIGINISAYSQEKLLDKEFQFSEKTVTVKQFLNELSSAGQFTFSYGQDVPTYKKVRISALKQSVRKHLDNIFKGDNIIYVEQGNKILLIKSVPKSDKKIPRQNIKGRITDLDSKQPLSDVNIILTSVHPILGTSTDKTGYFKFENVSVGRHNLQFSRIGYEPCAISNFQVASGKEYVVNVEMIESVVDLKEVLVTFPVNRSEPLNDLAFVSGRSFSAENVENYPGSFSDISRAALSFPGVLSSDDGENHMIIRGNSPKGLQWRLEGIEVPNLNHFSDIGASGGGVNIISNNMLARSDFFTGAFPAEYGNALSGVFDLRLRTGNNEKHEQTVQAGLVGTELMVEGPIKKNTNTTYIAQYRYSTFKLIELLGANLESVPDFQDLSFKIYHPTKKLGVFSLFGIGGLSHEVGDSGYDENSNTGTIGLSNSYTINESTNIRSIIAVSAWKYTWDQISNMGTTENPVDRDWNTDVTDYTIKASVAVNKKINANHKIKAGLIYEKAYDNSFMGWYSDTLFNQNNNPDNANFQNIKYYRHYVNSNLNASTLQTYFYWKYRLNKVVTFTTGIHYLKFYLNKNFSFEPRFGLNVNASQKHSFSAGFGIHSKKESLTLYSGQLELNNGVIIQPNIGLELTKAQHYVIGYNYRIAKFLNFKTEAYYQNLYDIPASPYPPYFSSINFDYGFEGSLLTNYGKGFNRGVEFCLEKFISKSYFFLLNGSWYKSKYKNKLGKILPTKYDGTYSTNGIFGKEFKVGSSSQNIFSISTRYILMGGMRNLPIDREATIANGYQINIWDYGFSEKKSDYFRIDLQLKFTRNKPTYSAEWTIDFINLTNRKNLLNEYWDTVKRDFVKEYQNPIIPIFTYRIQF